MRRRAMRILALLLGVVLLLASTDVPAADPSPRIKEIQEGLAELGYDLGSPDGVMGPETRKAISAFQKDHDFVVDGKYSELLLFKVNVQREIAKQEVTPEGKKRKEERERLLPLPNDDLISFIFEAFATGLVTAGYIVKQGWLVFNGLFGFVVELLDESLPAFLAASYAIPILGGISGYLAYSALSGSSYHLVLPSFRRRPVCRLPAIAGRRGWLRALVWRVMVRHIKISAPL